MGSIRKPLLPDSCNENGDETRSDVVVDQTRSAGVWMELRKQFDLAGYLVVANLMQYSILVISSMFVGHLGVLELSSATLATSFAGVTGFTVLIGLSTGLETLCGQAYGAKNYHLLGVYVQAATVVLLAVCVPISFVWLNMEKVLSALGQDPEISAAAGVYFVWLSPSLFASAISQPIVKFLQAQSAVFPIMLCSVLTVLAHIPTCFLLVFKLGLGFHGGALAGTIALYVNLFLLLLYVYFSNEFEETWKGLTREAFGAITIFLKLAIPSVAMICLEYWAFEVLVLLAGYMPNPQLEVSLLSICLTTGALTYMIPMGLSGAVSTRVSNELGADRPAAAKFAVKVVVCISIAVASIIATTEFLVRNVWGKAFTDDANVVHRVAQVMPLIAIASFLDGIQGVLSGVARGCGWQETGAWVNLGSYYVVGLPAAFVLGFYFQYGGLGLWFGFYCGLVLQTGTLAILTVMINWKKMAEDAQTRVKALVASEAESPLLV
ncbi:unnamed protein product [Calypogeia fissa]